MKHHLLLILLLLSLAACQSESSSNQGDNNQQQSAAQNAAPSPAPAAGGEAPDVDLDNDFVIKNNYGVIRGTKMPEDFNVEGNSRYFDFGELEVRTQGNPSLTGEQIRYRLKEQEEWQHIPEEDFLFFVGFDGHRHLIIDKGTEPVNRDIRLFDIYSGQPAYIGKYNDSMLKDGYLYTVRFASKNQLDTLPDCNTSPAGKEFLGYQKVVAVRLDNYEELPTGQVTCAYMKQQ